MKNELFVLYSKIISYFCSQETWNEDTDYREFDSDYDGKYTIKNMCVVGQNK